jgi:signal transduction histidine kinase
MNFIQRLISTDGFMPHGMCYSWNPAVIWLHVVSDALITISYYSIPLTLVYFVRRRKDLAFHWMFLLFAGFIVACGTTHLMEILNIWHPTYWLSGCIKAFTAIVSVLTAILLVRLIPKALALPSPEQLRNANTALQREIIQHAAATERAESLNLKLIRQAAELQETNQELETFSYSVSHDLRAPLRHINGYIELLGSETPAGTDPAQQRYMGTITELARQMTGLIDSLLAFSRLGRAALKPEWIDTSALVDEVRRELAPEMKDRNIAWNIGPLPKVYMDPDLFKQVWLNLLNNAIKYTSRRDAAQIDISSRETPTDFEFSIRDNGAGFDMNYADKLFGVFQRLHSKNDFEGTGIGLANVRRVITRHGGHIRAEGRPGEGATFIFTVPKDPAEIGSFHSQPLPPISS